MPTNLLIGQYKMLAVVAYTLFGLGLAFYATPSTDAALSNLPDDQAGSGSGIYKMASSSAPPSASRFLPRSLPRSVPTTNRPTGSRA